MKKMLTLLTVTMITASLTGCGCCRRCCPWLDRGAFCGLPYAAPATYAPAPYAPVAAAAPAYQPYTPLAATTASPCCGAPAPQYYPMAAQQQCCPAPAPTQCCSSWDPCQGQVNYSYAPQAAQQAPCCAPQGYAPMQAAPMGVAPMAYSGEPSCAYFEPGCGGPIMGGPMMGMSYGPMMSGGCDTCGTGYSGTTVGPSPAVVMPGPGE